MDRIFYSAYVVKCIGLDSIIMEQKSVSRSEIVSDLEDIIEEIRSGKYLSIALLQSIMINERRVNNYISESYQVGKQVMITLKQSGIDDGN